MTRWRRWAGASLAAAAVALSACGPDAAHRAASDVGCTLENSVAIIMAQAVPTAQRLPCIQAFPAGWSFRTFDARRGRTTIWLENDRAGPEALAIEVTGPCGAAGTEVPSDEPATRLYLRIGSLQPRYTGVLIYGFEGGCVRLRFDFPPEASTVLTTDAKSAVSLFEREIVDRELAKEGFRIGSGG